MLVIDILFTNTCHIPYNCLVPAYRKHAAGMLCLDHQPNFHIYLTYHNFMSCRYQVGTIIVLHLIA